MTDEIRLVVHPFEMGTSKEAALKPLEEAAEIFGAYQLYEGWANVPESEYATVEQLNDIDAINLANLADEIADCVQACCNLAARYGIDLDVAMRRCEERNRERGRYKEPEMHPRRYFAVRDWNKWTSTDGVKHD